MHRIFRHRSLPALAVFAAAVFASGAQAGAIEQLRTFMSTTPSARGEFEQRSSAQGARSGASATGSFAFTRPGKFRWEVRKPFEQMLVADGEQVFFYDRDLNQVTIKRLGDALGQTPAAVLFGKGDPETSFALRELPERDALAWVELIPHSKEAGVHRIAIGFRDGLPVQMEVLDAFSHTSLFTFRNIVRASNLPAGIFRFVIPPGADVLRQ